MTERRSVLKALILAPLVKAPKQEEADVGPAEDLMREHGILRRVMFIYDDIAAKLESHAPAPLDPIARAAAMIEKVIHGYHEKLEEQFVFPRLENALTATLRKQHEAGRAATAQIAKLSKAANDPASLAKVLRAFNRMYRPHAAREDTVLFPAFHDLLGNKAYAALGEQFESEERKQLGNEGFEGAVAQVAKLEEALGLHDLAQFTA